MNLPKIIYGTAWKKERTTSLVVEAVLKGFWAIDTACQPKHYREDLVGEALLTLQKEHNIKREDLWIQTKFTSIDGQDRNQPLPYDPSLPVTQQVLGSFQTSLRNLHTTYLDSYILHSPLRTAADTLEAWNVMMQLQDEGKVKLIGMSNTYDVGILEGLERQSGGRGVQVVQNRWYEGNAWDREVVKYCVGKQIMYQSFWTLSGSPGLLASGAVRSIAKKAKRTEAEVVYKIAQLHGITPLSGTTNPVHMKQDVGVEYLNLTLPSSEESQEIEKVKKAIFG